MDSPRSRFWYAGTLAIAVAAAGTKLSRAETVYEFTMDCNRMELGACFDRITERLDRVKKRDNGSAFCLPRAWGQGGYITSGYPVSILEHLRIGLSASRFGKAAEPVENAMSDILNDVYPCD